jgi:hypothetical protein
MKELVIIPQHLPSQLGCLLSSHDDETSDLLGPVHGDPWLLRSPRSIFHALLVHWNLIEQATSLADSFIYPQIHTPTNVLVPIPTKLAAVLRKLGT